MGKRILSGFAALIVSLVLSLTSSVVYALSPQCSGPAEYGTNECRGYFSNNQFATFNGYVPGTNILFTNDGDNDSDNGYAIPDEVNNASTFKTFITNNLGLGSNYDFNKAGAAFIVDTMLEVNGGPFAGGVTGGIAYAQSHLDAWLSLIDRLQNLGWVQWNIPFMLQPGTINSEHVCNSPPATNKLDCAANRNNPGWDAQDVTFWKVSNPVDSELGSVINFSDGKSSYAIFRNCANVVTNGGSLAVPQPPVINGTCGGYSIDPGNPEAHTPFKVTVVVQYNTVADATTVNSFGNPKMNVSVTGSKLNYNNPDLKPINQTNNTLTGTTPSLTSNDTGRYTISWGVSSIFGSSQPQPCSATFDIADHPYFTSSSVKAGAGMNTTSGDCKIPANTSAGITSWNEGPNSYAGAGTEFAALALSDLQGFATAQGSGLSSDSVAFSNVASVGSNPPTGIFGGQFGSLSCTYDYFANAVNIQKGPLTLPVKTKDMVITGNQAVVQDESDTVTYVNGDVYINKDIILGQNNSDYGQDDPISDIPTYDVIVQGNIYIAPNVKELDGIYVAEPDPNTGAGGIIYTCANIAGPQQFATPALDGALYDRCKNTLNVNGAFVAKQVWLLRTAGTLSTSVTPNPVPAETFNFTPEIWLSIPLLNGPGFGGSPHNYDAITALSPVL